MKGWIAVDLDGTLAVYDHWRGPEHIGEPVPIMLARVKRWLAEGKDVRIFTARMHHLSCHDSLAEMTAVCEAIERWCEKHIGQQLAITCEKDYGMIELWDDRCVQVEKNTGRRMDGEAEE